MEERESGELKEKDGGGDVEDGERRYGREKRSGEEVEKKLKKRN